jgi:DNA invertase Pin-like site-specific DNA recombinase
MFVRAYLRASTKEQDATRARASLERFAADHHQVIACEYLENESGTKLDRPELLRLLNDSRDGDVLLLESIDRLSRLPADDWNKLKAVIDSKGIKIVALDLPTTHQGMTAQVVDEFTARMLGAISGLMVELMAAIARKDYEQRRERQSQGIKAAQAADAGKYKGRSINEDLHWRVRELLAGGYSIRATARLAQCSSSTVQTIKSLGL